MFGRIREKWYSVKEFLIESILGILGYMGVIIGLIAFVSVRCVVTGKHILTRIFVFGMYVWFGYVYLTNRRIFWKFFFIFLGILAFLATLYYIITKIPEKKTYDENESEYDSCYYHFEPIRIEFFEGLAPQEAKQKYRELMKRYHPDNEEGSVEMSQRINDAYEKYCSIFGK